MRIETENLGKRFKREWIFRNFTFTFAEQQVYAIVGPNGSGKSTLMQILWGQMVPSKGTVQYREKEQTVPPDEYFKEVSIATPYMELIEEFTLQEMIDFHYQFKRPKGGVSKASLLELMELAHAKDKAIANFSSGMRQRLKLALAFYSDTPFLFLDEPTTNLDKKAIEWYQKHLVIAMGDRTVLIASNQEHEYPESAAMVDLARLK